MTVVSNDYFFKYNFITFKFSRTCSTEHDQQREAVVHAHPRINGFKPTNFVQVIRTSPWAA
ncbi:hypothetical protein JOE32_003169 [Pseudomonas sp. PvP025]|nr:hypothetical protein [Pseudomonas sp. PvP025]MDQ0400562.1 hypothetical protein [Pseudomonas sp. PvP006]